MIVINYFQYPLNCFIRAGEIKSLMSEKGTQNLRPTCNSNKQIKQKQGNFIYLQIILLRMRKNVMILTSIDDDIFVFSVLCVSRVEAP